MLTRYAFVKPNGKKAKPKSLRQNKVYDAHVIGVRFYTEGKTFEDEVTEIILEIDTEPVTRTPTNGDDDE